MNEKEITERFHEFRKLCLTHVYSEPDTSLHMNVMKDLIPKLVTSTKLTSEEKILDVGCGQGYGMMKFAEHGCTNIQGITLSPEDVDASRKRGFTCTAMDMSFMEFDDDSFDFLFVRHALEHSPYPLLTLKEFFRVTAIKGGVYIEMPSPKCDRNLEAYDNHYSIMGVKQWKELMFRVGFEIVDHGEITFDITATDQDWSGTEIYEWYLLLKPPKK